jgi:hypothetical protein
MSCPWKWPRSLLYTWARASAGALTRRLRMAAAKSDANPVRPIIEELAASPVKQESRAPKHCGSCPWTPLWRG